MSCSIKSPLRNYNTNYKSTVPTISSPITTGKQSNYIDTVNLCMKLTHISKMLEDSVLKFSKRFLIVSTEMEEMKREFLGQSSLIGEYVTLTKKEIMFDRYENFGQGKLGNTSPPPTTRYEEKCLNNALRSNHCSSMSNINSCFMGSTKKTNKSLIVSGRNSNACQIKKNKTNNMKNTPKSKNSSSNIFNYNNEAKFKEFFSNEEIRQLNRNDEHKKPKVINQYPNKNPFTNEKQNNNSRPISKSKKSSIKQADTSQKKSERNLIPSVEEDNKNVFYSFNDKLNKSPDLQSTKEMNNLQKALYHNSMLSNIKDNKNKALYILLNKTNLLECEDKLKVPYLNRELYSVNTNDNILDDCLSDLDIQIKKAKSEADKIKPTETEKESFNQILSYPTKTSSFVLNSLDNDKENLIFNSKSEITLRLTKLIYDCLGETWTETNDIKKAYETLYEKYKIKSIHNLFKNILYKKIFCDLIDNNKDNKSEIEKLNKLFSESEEDIINAINEQNDKILPSLGVILQEMLEYLKCLNNIDDTLKNKLKPHIKVKNLEDQYEYIKNIILS